MAEHCPHCAAPFPRQRQRCLKCQPLDSAYVERMLRQSRERERNRDEILEFLEEVASGPYPDSNHVSLLTTLAARAKKLRSDAGSASAIGEAVDGLVRAARRTLRIAVSSYNESTHGCTGKGTGATPRMAPSLSKEIKDDLEIALEDLERAWKEFIP